MYRIRRQASNNVDMEFTESISADDLDRMSVDLERLVAEHDQLRILCRMPEGQAWQDVGALAHDLKLDLHFNPHVERFAIVGDERWHAWITQLIKPFAHGQVRYFDHADEDRAWTWIAAEADS